MATELDTEKANETVNGAYKALERLGAARIRNLGILALVVALFSVYAIVDRGFELYFQRTIDALNNGFIYAAMALSLVLIYKATGVVNFAQGNMAMFGAFIAYVLVAEQGWPVTAGIVVAMLVSALGAAAIERVFIRPFDPGNHLAITIVTLAWFLILGSLAGVLWGFDPKAFPTPFPHSAGDSFTVFGATVRYDRIGTWLVILVVLALVSVLLRKTKIGLAFRSVSTNLESSKLVGISIGRTLQFGWALAAAVGTLAGCMIAPNTYLTPGFMTTVLIYSFAAATLGGLDSLGGAVIGGLLVGLLETMVGGYIGFLGSELALASALGVIVIILLVTPSGLFGSKRVERV